jgi:hypothetical protein
MCLHDCLNSICLGGLHALCHCYTVRQRGCDKTLINCGLVPTILHPTQPWIWLHFHSSLTWFPIWAFITDQVAAMPIPATAMPGDLPPMPLVSLFRGDRQVQEAPPGGVVHQSGLFSSSDLQTQVPLPASGCPSGWGVHPLLCLELVALWDVLILVSDAMSEESDILILHCSGGVL